MKEGLKGETRAQRQGDITDIRKFTLSLGLLSLLTLLLVAESQHLMHKVPPQLNANALLVSPYV